LLDGLEVWPGVFSFGLHKRNDPMRMLFLSLSVLFLFWGCTQETTSSETEMAFERVEAGFLSFEVPAGYETLREPDEVMIMDILVDSSYQVRGRWTSIPEDYMSENRVIRDSLQTLFGRQYEQLTRNLEPSHLGTFQVEEKGDLVVLSQSYFSPYAFEEGINVYYLMVYKDDQACELLVKGRAEFKDRNQEFTERLLQSMQVKKS
jgi:hypothetical protein